jgi:biopolymer transport protein ExbD
MVGMESSETMLKHTAPPPVADINVTPMVDVMLVLLIIFMVITPMLSKGVQIDKVKTRNPIAMQAADRSDAVLISVTRDGKTYLGRDQVSPDSIAAKVKDMLSNRTDKECFLSGDSRAKYQVVMDVVANLQAAGVDQLGLITEQMQDARRSDQIQKKSGPSGD